MPFHSESSAVPRVVVLTPEMLWDQHGASLFALAWSLLGDESAAILAATRGLVDLYRVPDPEPTLRSAARCVYRQCHETSAAQQADRESALPDTPLPAWLGELAWTQRSALALCFFGGHTYREAAIELDLVPDAAARLLVSGLRELGRSQQMG